MLSTLRHWIKHQLGRCLEIRGDGKHDDWRGIQAAIDNRGLLQALHWISQRPGHYVVNRTLYDRVAKGR